MAKVKAPASQDELAELLADKTRMKDVLATPDALSDLIQGYADNFAKADRGTTQEQILEQARETAQLAVAEALKGTPRAGGEAGALDLSVPLPEAIARESARIRQSNQGLRRTSAEKALWNRHAPGTRVDGMFADIAEIAQATAPPQKVNLGPAAAREMAAKRAKLTEIMNSFGSEVPADGGFLIPENLRSELLSVALETAVVRPRATVIPMDSLRVPIPMIDDTSHVSNVFGGVQGYWVEEAQALTESQASFGRVVLDARKLTLYATVPNELLQDAPAFAGFFDSKFPQALAYFEDVAFFTGNGTSEPQGFINCPASVQVSAESGQPTATIVWENITKMYARMLPTSLRSAVWIAAIDTFPQLATMALSVGTGGSAVWIGNTAGNSGADMPPVSILGRPVIFTEKASTLGTTGDISFVDLGYYLIGDRMAMQSMVSEHYLFANDKVAYRIIERVDGRPWLQSAITPHNNSSSTLTPFVQLASR